MAPCLTQNFSSLSQCLLHRLPTFRAITESMKQLFFFAFFLPLLATAQDCALTREKDQFSQEPKITTGFMPFKTLKRFSLSLDATKKEIDFFFNLTSVPDHCFDDQSTAVITFEGGKLKSTFKNTGSMNCQGLFHFNFKNQAATPSLLQRMASKKIPSIKLIGSRGEVELLLNEQQQEQLMKAINCMVTEAKTLL